MTNSQVAEAFANGDTEGNSLHIIINGDLIYSYGYHFPIARRVGGNNVLFTSRNYSVTTSTHKSKVFGALYRAGYNIIEVDNVDDDHRKDNNLALLDTEIVEARECQKRARKEFYKDAWAKQVERLMKNKANYLAL